MDYNNMTIEAHNLMLNENINILNNTEKNDNYQKKNITVKFQKK